MKKKCSIIIPVYNVEKYIEKCVKSISNQDYENIEIILVDDGSTDHSGLIIDKLKMEDHRIIVIHQDNQGVSSARNAGLSAASGDYVTFVDGDDWVDTDYISYFIKLLDESECDIAMNKNNYAYNRKYSSANKYIISSEKAIEWIYSGSIFVAVWNKMYRRKILDRYEIKFNKEIWYGEGMLFNIEILQYVDKIILGEKAVYHQTFNPDSAMRKFNLESQLCGIKSLELQKGLWKKKNQTIENEWRYHKYWFNRYIIDGLIRSDMLSENLKIYNDCVSDLRKNIIIPLKVEKNIKRKIMWCCYFIAPKAMAIRNAVQFKRVAKCVQGGGKISL